VIFEKIENGFLIKNKEDLFVGTVDTRTSIFYVENCDAEFNLTELLEVCVFMSTIKKGV
jgi:hypothetical protein